MLVPSIPSTNTPEFGTARRGDKIFPSCHAVRKPGDALRTDVLTSNFRPPGNTDLRLLWGSLCFSGWSSSRWYGCFGAYTKQRFRASLLRWARSDLTLWVNYAKSLNRPEGYLCWSLPPSWCSSFWLFLPSWPNTILAGEWARCLMNALTGKLPTAIKHGSLAGSAPRLEHK